MKRKLIALLVALLPLSASAINYDDARREAYYLTDKMAYELNLSPEQYEYVYQINLDYFLSVNSARDINSTAWNYRNMDLQYVLDAWQYSQFMAIDYFFRPIVWRQSSWFFPVANHYSIGFYYFSRPNYYTSYQGRTWAGRQYDAPSPYRGVVFSNSYGMRDRYRSAPPAPSRYDNGWHNGWNNNRGHSGRTYDNRYDNRRSPQPSTPAMPQQRRNYTPADRTAGRAGGSTNQGAPQRPVQQPAQQPRTYAPAAPAQQQSAPSRQSSAPAAAPSTQRSTGRTFGR